MTRLQIILLLDIQCRNSFQTTNTILPKSSKIRKSHKILMVRSTLAEFNTKHCTMLVHTHIKFKFDSAIVTQITIFGN